MRRKSDPVIVREARAFLKSPFLEGPGRMPFGLTDRQAEIARLAAYGWQVQRIATATELTPGSVTSHLRDIKAKTGMGKLHLTWYVIDRLKEILQV